MQILESLHFLSGEMLFESITLKKHSIEYQDITIQESTLTGYQMA
jgi:hypothetical protein